MVIEGVEKVVSEKWEGQERRDLPQWQAGPITKEDRVGEERDKEK